METFQTLSVPPFSWSKYFLLFSFKTSTVLNSWATVCLWRRYFKYDEETDERLEVEACHDNNVNYYNDFSVDEVSSTTPALVRSEWARRELSEFCRSTSARDYCKQPQYREEPTQVSNPPPPAPTTTPLTGLDHPDLRVNGMFLPQ